MPFPLVDIQAAAGGGVSPVAFVGASTPTANVIDKPTGTASGHILLGVVSATSTETINVPSGFTQIISYAETAIGSYKLAAFWKLAGGSEPSTYTFSGSFGTISVGLSTWSGVDTTTPCPQSGGASGSFFGTTVTAPGFTTSRDNCAIIRIGSDNNNSTVTWDVPSSHTERYDGRGQALSNFIKTPAGATGTASMSMSGAGSPHCITLVLQPTS